MILILSTTDAWHSHESKSFLGIFNDDEILKEYVIDHALESEDGGITDHDADLLFSIKQTQGRSENYIIDEEELNPAFNL